MDARIKTLLEEIERDRPALYPIVTALRALALAPGVTEKVKYGGLLYAAAGEGFCGIFAYAAHVSLEFSEGHALPDPHRLLQGNGKKRRHLKFLTLADLDRLNPDVFIRAARG